MSSNEAQSQYTQHAFLVAWGWFAHEIGLVQQMAAVPLKQKRYHHTPQNKVLEFLVAILAGLTHLQDISLAAHPLDKDQAVADAWGQAGWADYSGVSRTLSGLSWDEVQRLVAVLREISEPFLASELDLLRLPGQRMQLDGDLTGIAVSSTSRTYPNAAFGHMDDEVRLGYQAGVVSLVSPTYGRLWLSMAHHPGDTVSCTQAAALVLAAEARTGLRPRRRTELLRQRLQALEQAFAPLRQRFEAQQRALQRAKERLLDAEQELAKRRQRLTDLEAAYQVSGHTVRPTGRLAQARRQVETSGRHLTSRQKAWQRAEHCLEKTTQRWQGKRAVLNDLYDRLSRFERDNATNSAPIAVVLRLDAGFGTYENVALLIEMGYEVYTKPYNQKVVTHLRREVADQTAWVRVGANAELIAWPNRQLKRCPYPLDVALERFYTGKTRKHSALLHFGTDLVTENLPGWFERYNGRQIIEAGIKETKQVFRLHHIKVRAEPAIYLQECFVIFAANFIRWASHWLATQAQSAENGLNLRHLGVKRQVQVAAHVSAQVIRSSEGKLLRFSEHSAFAGKVLHLPAHGLS